MREACKLRREFISWKYIFFPKEFIGISGVIKTDTERKETYEKTRREIT